MEIALMADDKKKELMIQFCIAYAGILNKHNLCATGATARLISEATGLSIEPYLGGIQGGGEQVIARISCDEIDLVIYFRDSQAASSATPVIFLMLQTSRLPRCSVSLSKEATLTGVTILKAEDKPKNF